MLLWISLGVWFCSGIGRLAPETPIGRFLRTWIVLLPAAWLSRRTAGELAGLLLAAAMVAVLAPTLPAEMALLMASDAAAYVELLGAIAVLALQRGRHRVIKTCLT